MGPMSDTSNTEPAPELAQTFDASWQSLLSALSKPDAYIELMMIALAITVACMVTFLARRRLTIHLERHPPRKLDKSYITRPMALLAPLLAFFLLGVTKPFALRYAGHDDWTTAAMQLALAFAGARLVTMVIKSRGMAYFIAAVLIMMVVLDVTGFMASIRAALDGIAFSFGKFRLSVLGLVQGTIILIIVFWVASALASTLENYLLRSSRLNYTTRALIVKFFRITVYVIAFLITLSAMGIDLTALAIFGGALGVGIGLGLQKITANFVSGVTLLLEKSIKIGDLIEISNTTGWVRQLNVRYALIETMDGREMIIPNETLISTLVTNWTHSNDLARVEFLVGVSYEADLDLVKSLALEAVAEHPKSLQNPPPTCHLREYGNSALVFRITFWIGDVKDGRAGPQSDVMISLYRKFKDHNIEIPFPQQVSYHHEVTPVKTA